MEVTTSRRQGCRARRKRSCKASQGKAANRPDGRRGRRCLARTVRGGLLLAQIPSAPAARTSSPTSTARHERSPAANESGRRQPAGKEAMKTNPPSLKSMLAAAALLCLSSADAWARPPRARESCGVIQAIDPQTHTLTVQSPKRDQPLTVVWKRDTKFIHNWKFTDSAALKEGLRACVYYRSPIFGKPFVTKVVWVNGKEQSPTTPKNHE